MQFSLVALVAVLSTADALAFKPWNVTARSVNASSEVEVRSAPVPTALPELNSTVPDVLAMVNKTVPKPKGPRGFPPMPFNVTESVARLNRTESALFNATAADVEARMAPKNVTKFGRRAWNATAARLIV